jgi:uncharacterized protein (DUF4415 family)
MKKLKTTKTDAHRVDDDNPEWTEKDFRRARPAREVHPELVAAYENGTLRYRGQRGPQKTPTKRQVTLRLDPAVLSFFKAKGAGWQTRISDTLKAIVEATR